MPWIVLLASAVLEAVWATALGYSQGLSRPLPTVVFAVALVASMAGLGWAVRRIPIGTAYAVWTGIGTLGAAAWGMLVLGEPSGALRIVCIGLIALGIAGLKLLPA